MILAEVQRNLVRAAGLGHAQAGRLIEVLSSAFPDALTTIDEQALHELVNAPEDRHVLATAIAAGAAVIVTENLSDFPHAALARYATQAFSIDQFLYRLFEFDPVEMAMVIQQQAHDLKNPPISVDELLDHLAGWAPTFVSAIR